MHRDVYTVNHAELAAFDEVIVRMRLGALVQNRLTLLFEYWRCMKEGERRVPTPVPEALREALRPYAPMYVPGHRGLHAFPPAGPARSKSQPCWLMISRPLERLTEARLSGPADLVVEVISDDSVSRDRADKFYEYQSAGVQEYWIIDPRPGYKRVDFYILDHTGRYRPIPVDADGRYRSTVVPGFWFEVDWVLSEEPPNVLQALNHIVGPEKLLAQSTPLS